MAYRGDDYGDATTFDEKHTEHTGHDVEWTIYRTYTAETLDIDERVVTCDGCGKEWVFLRQADALKFQTEHEQYTEHSSVDLSVRQLEIHDVDLSEYDQGFRAVHALIETLEEHFESPIPHHVLLTHAEENDWDGSAVETELHELKRQGEVYEPVTNQYRTV